ncbi:MAG TPA: UDP-N-acetylmuramate dehydrogenase [Ktedonobacterales bacterium]
MADTRHDDEHERQMMLADLGAIFGTRLKPREPLSRHGTFGVGGPADAFVTLTREDELLRLARLAREHNWPLMLVGNGTNVLYADAGAQGIVARMALNDWHVEGAESERPLLVAGAGVSLPKLANDLAERGLAGFEWSAGVPGTIGGAVVSNAGAHGECVADILVTARVLFAGPDEPEPVVRALDAAELEMGYRHSRFRAGRRVVFGDDGVPVAAPRAAVEPPEMITGATFQLRHDDPAAVRARVERNKRHRRETQPPQPSAGSVFKNPNGTYSGKLIEEAGLKGTRAGGAEISTRHANFIVNTGGATAADVVALIAQARRTVRERFDIELELEVELRGDW